MSLEIPKIIKTNCYYDKRGYLQEIYLKKNLKKNLKFYEYKKLYIKDS